MGATPQDMQRWGYDDREIAQFNAMQAVKKTTPDPNPNPNPNQPQYDENNPPPGANFQWTWDEFDGWLNENGEPWDG